MNFSTAFCDITGLQQAENTYRTELRSQPDNMALRRGLAWCLFLQAIHQSGLETALTDTALVGGEAANEADYCIVQESAVRSAQTLLRESLYQAYTIKRLSTHQEDQNDVERLQTLVELAGAGGLAAHADAQSIQQLMALASAASGNAPSD